MLRFGWFILKYVPLFKQIFPIVFFPTYLQIDDCKTNDGYACKFPSMFKGNEIRGCTKVNSPTGDLWCFTKGKTGPKWGYCTGLCPINCNQNK